MNASNNLSHMKAKAGNSTVRRPRVQKSSKRPANEAKAKRRTGFAPELCGVMAGPSDLSVREGFVRE